MPRPAIDSILFSLSSCFYLATKRVQVSLLLRALFLLLLFLFILPFAETVGWTGDWTTVDVKK